METLIGDWPFWLNVLTTVILLIFVPFLTSAAMRPHFPAKDSSEREKQSLLLICGVIFSVWLYECSLWLLLSCTQLPDPRAGSLAVLVAVIFLCGPVLLSGGSSTPTTT